jgi:hypothetical protein
VLISRLQGARLDAVDPAAIAATVVASEPRA